MKKDKKLNEGTYQVIVNNIGNVHDGDDYDTAYEAYEEYVDMSQHGGGRAFGEDVYLIEDGDIIEHYDGDLSDEYEEEEYAEDGYYPDDDEEGYAYTDIAMMPEDRKQSPESIIQEKKFYENVYNDKPFLNESLHLMQEMGEGTIEWETEDEFIFYLNHTLIPDLYNSGRDATAEDFETCALNIERGIYDENFIEYLENILIPDLYESGRDATAEDFEIAVGYMKNLLDESDKKKGTVLKEEYEEYNDDDDDSTRENPYAYIDEITEQPVLGDKLETALKDNGYEGVDADLDISLFDYGMLYSEKQETLILHGYKDEYYDNDDISFIVMGLDRRTIEEALSDMDEGFYHTVGISKDEYFHYLDGNIVNVVYDINHYNSAFIKDGGFNYSAEELYNLITNSSVNESREVSEDILLEMNIDTLLKDHDGTFPSNSWPGGYPIYYLSADGGIFCPACANEAKNDPDIDINDPDDPQWNIIDGDINWEDDDLYCDHCNKKIECAYCDDEQGEVNESVIREKKAPKSSNKSKEKSKGVSSPPAYIIRKRGTKRFNYPETDEPEEVETPEDIEVADNEVYDYGDKTYKIKKWELTNKRHRKGAVEVDEYEPSYEHELSERVTTAFNSTGQGGEIVDPASNTDSAIEETCDECGSALQDGRCNECGDAFKNESRMIQEDDEHAPSDKDTIREAIARAFFVSNYADAYDRAKEDGIDVDELDHAGSGQDWFDEDAYEYADKFIADLERVNGKSLEELFYQALDRDQLTVGQAPKYPFDSLEEEFGHYLAMEAMGHGVEWSDDHSDHGIDVPYAEDYMVYVEDYLPDEAQDVEDEDEDEDEDSEPTEPEDEDWVINEDEGAVYEYNGSRKPVLTFQFSDDYDWDDLFAEIRDEMEDRGWYPNVWRYSDHGNWFLQSMNESKNNNKKIIAEETVERFVNLSNLKGHFKDYIAHDNVSDTQLSELVNKINSANDSDSVDEALDFANEIFNGYGVEPIRSEDAWDNYYGDAIALYVNFGDTYSPTLLYDIEENEFYLTSWGDWYEGWEQEQQENSDDDDNDNDNESENDEDEDYEGIDTSWADSYIIDPNDPNNVIKKESYEITYDMIDEWIMIDDTLRHMALEEGVSEADLGNDASDEYNRFIEDNYNKITDSIRKAMGE